MTRWRMLRVIKVSRAPCGRGRESWSRDRPSAAVRRTLAPHGLSAVRTVCFGGPQPPVATIDHTDHSFRHAVSAQRGRQRRPLSPRLSAPPPAPLAPPWPSNQPSTLPSRKVCPSKGTNSAWPTVRISGADPTKSRWKREKASISALIFAIGGQGYSILIAPERAYSWGAVQHAPSPLLKRLLFSRHRRERRSNPRTRNVKGEAR